MLSSGVDLGAIHSDAIGAQALGPHLARLTSLQHLNLRNSELGVAGAEAPGPHLASLTALQSINVGNGFGAAGAETLVTYLASLKQMLCFHVIDNGMSLKDRRVLKNAVRAAKRAAHSCKG